MALFEKASAPEGERRRIAGIISTEKLDKQGEVVVQKGLNFNTFLKEGYFNDNHSKKTADVLGAPDRDGVKKFQKGDRLPDGTTADTNLTWAEGYLFDTPDASRIWNLGMAMKKSGAGRRLGFSIEGSILRRSGPANRVVAEADVRNVAITNCPVGEGTRLETLAKSLTEAELPDADVARKALTMGDSSGHPSNLGSVTGAGAGRIIATQSLEHDGQAHISFGTPKKKKKDEDEEEVVEKSIAVALLKHRLGCSSEAAERAYESLTTLKSQGLL
jgi:hypothetical protein